MKMRELLTDINKVIAKSEDKFIYALDKHGNSVSYDSSYADKWSLYGAFSESYNITITERESEQYKRILAAMPPHKRYSRMSAPLMDYSTREDVNPEDIIQLVKDADV